MELPEIDFTKLKGVKKGLGEPTIGWHIVGNLHEKEAKLGYGDNRIVQNGSLLKFHRVDHIYQKDPVLCEQGMHACHQLRHTTTYRKLLDSKSICYVAVYGIPEGEDGSCEWDFEFAPKFVGTHRETLFMIDSHLFDHSNIYHQIHNIKTSHKRVNQIVAKLFYQKYKKPLYWEKYPR